MSRTYRKEFYSPCAFRYPKTQNERKNSLLAVDELLDYGFNPSNRLKSTVARKPTAYDDIVISAYFEKSGNKSKWYR